MRTSRVRIWHVALVLVLLGVVAARVRYQLRYRAAVASVLESEQWGREGEMGGAPYWPMPDKPPELRWEVWREGDELVVAYEVINATDQTLWVYDVPAGGPELIYAYPGEKLGLAVLFRGSYLYERNGPARYDYLDVHPRALAPGEVVTGLARRALPIRADVENSAVNLLGESVEQIRLEIAWTLDTEDREGILQGPFVPPYASSRYGVYYQRWLVSEPVELP